MPDILGYFDFLVEKGLKAIPLRPLSKVPACRAWTEWNYASCRNVFQASPDSNIGLLLGDVLDVEGDSESANATIWRLVGNCEHPTYTSAKSTHHLFRNPDKDLTVLRANDIEFRAHRHQSVLPPSVLPGVNYRWLSDLSFPMPEMPLKLMQFYRSLRFSGVDLKPGHLSLPCSTCRSKCYIHQRRFELELSVFKFFGLSWQCQTCRTIDIRPICRQARRKKKRGISCDN